MNEQIKNDKSFSELIKNLSEDELIDKFKKIYSDNAEKVCNEYDFWPRDEKGYLIEDYDYEHGAECNYDIEDQEDLDNFTLNKKAHEQRMDILKRLADIGSAKSIDFTANLLLNVNPYCLHYYEELIIDILEKNKNYSAIKLLETAKKSDNYDGITRSMILLAMKMTDIKFVFENLSFLANEKEKIIELWFLDDILKSAQLNKEKITFEALKDLNIQAKTTNQELSEDEEENEKLKQDIINIAERNYQKIFTDENGRVNEAAVKDIIEDLKKNLDNIKDQRAYLLKYKDEVIAFCRFEPISETEIYAGSFNVYDDLKACGIGKYFSDRALAEEAKEHIIKMKSRIDNPCNKMYEQQGFVEEKRVVEKRGNLDIEYIYYKMDKREKNTQKDKIAA